MESHAHKDVTHTNSASNGASKITKIAYAVSERNGRSFWNRIGVAFVNKDGSLNVKLEAVPVTGQLQLRDWEPRDDAPAGRGSPGVASGGSRPTARENDTILTELPF